MPTDRHPARRAAGLALTLALGIGALAACGSDDDTPAGSDATEAGSPEDHKAPMEEVLAGLPKIKAAGDEAATAAAAGDFDAALASYDELREIWEEVEGTIKDTDRDVYEAMETAQSLIKDGAENDDPDRVAQGAEAQATAIDEFVAANS